MIAASHIRIWPCRIARPLRCAVLLSICVLGSGGVSSGSLTEATPGGSPAAGIAAEQASREADITSPLPGSEALAAKLRVKDQVIQGLETRVDELERLVAESIKERKGTSPEKLRSLPSNQPLGQMPSVRTDGTDASSIESRLNSLEERLGGRNLKDLEAKLNEALHKLKISDLAGANYFNSADTAFMLQCFVFTLLMTLPGLALFYGGLVRVQNVLSIVMQTFSIACLITLLWLAFGYSLCFSEGSPIYGDHRNFWLNSVTFESYHPLAPHVPEVAFILYQLAFAILTPAIICGSFADRMRLLPMLAFMTLWHLLVYCPLAHIMWTETGFLHKIGIIDFAGGNVVHVAAGFSGLVSSFVVGKRKGFGREAFAAHNMLLSVMGASMLWIGWLSFNAGPSYEVGPRASQAMLNTQVGAASGSVAWMSTEWVFKRRPSVFGIISGALAGLIAVTPGAGYYDHTGAFVSAFGSGALCYWTVQLKNSFSFDDALDAFGIHGPAAIWGGMTVGFFAKKDVGGVSGCFEGQCQQVPLQLLGIVVSVVWSSVVTYICLKFVDATMGLRVDESAEIMGLDMLMHGERLNASQSASRTAGSGEDGTDWHQQEIEELQHLKVDSGGRSHSGEGEGGGGVSAGGGGLSAGGGGAHAADASNTANTNNNGSHNGHAIFRSTEQGIAWYP